jgi:hypothetical protein
MMQFSKDGMPPATKILRLKNGEILIATVQYFGNDCVLERPMSMVSLPVIGKTGKMEKVGVYLKDWVEYSNDTYFTIPKEMVLVMAEPDQRMYADYLEAKIHSDIQKAQSELAEVMQEYISKMEFPSMKGKEEDDKPSEDGYNPTTNEDEDTIDEEDEDDGLPWWKGDPRIRF